MLCRSSLGASRRARLVQLPIAVAGVRHGVQTVLCNCYPFLDKKGGREGKRLLASLHEVNPKNTFRAVPLEFFFMFLINIPETHPQQFVYCHCWVGRTGYPDRKMPPTFAAGRVMVNGAGHCIIQSCERTLLVDTIVIFFADSRLTSTIRA